MRNLNYEVEMDKICREIWPFLKSKKEFPAILSKQGGSSGKYNPGSHTVMFRWNVWNKMPFAGQRLLAIHELWHASGNNHNGVKLFCHGLDILSILIYKKIWGEDCPYYRSMVYDIERTL